MEYKFKIRTTSQVRQAPSQKGDQQASRLVFVNINSPTQVKDKATRRKIRRHVMKDIGRSRRRYPIYSPNEVQTTAAVSKSPPRSIPLYWGDVKVCMNFKRLFWAMDMVSEGLLALAVDDSAYEFRQRLDQGLDNAQQREQAPNQARFLDEMEQYTESLSLVRKSIVAPESQAGRYAITGTIICLAFFDMRIRNRDRWAMHMEGLQRLVELGGGVEVLDSCPALRQSLFLADVLGSLVDDAPPRFPSSLHASTLPCGTMPQYGYKLLTSLQGSGSVLPLDTAPLVVIDSALRSASQLATMLNQVWSADRMNLDLLIPVCTIAHDVLTLPNLAYSGPSTRRQDSMLQITPICAAAELIRVSVLALLSTVITTTSDDNLYCASGRRGPARQLLTQAEDGVWTGSEELKLWVLVIQTLMEAGSARPWFLDQMIHVMSLLSLKSWDDLMHCIRQVVWVEKAAIPEMAQLKSDIERRLTTSH